MNHVPTPEERIRAEGGTIRHITPGPGQRFGRLPVLTLADARRAPPRRWLLRNLIAEGDLVLIYGAPKSGKSFLATRLAWGLSLGKGFGQHDAKREASVLYTAAEGAGGFPARLEALYGSLGDPRDAFRFIPASPTIGDPGDDEEALAAAARETRSELLIVDTVSRTFGAGDENLARDMSAYIAALDRVREQGRWPEGPPITCILVHHGAKHAPGSRGSTALPAAADVIVRVERLADGHLATVEAAKDAPDGLTIPFRLTRVDLPPSADGEPQSTCIAEPGETAITPKRDPLSPQALAALRHLGDLIGREGRPFPAGSMFPSHPDQRCVPMATWRKSCAERSLSTSEDRRAQNAAFSRAADALFRGGYVASADRGGERLVWLAKPPGTSGNLA